jgi:hypothetical protein
MLALSKFGEGCGYIPGSRSLVTTVLVGDQFAERSLAEVHRTFQYRVKHGPEVAGCGIDDLQNLGGRGLLLQCFGKRSITLGKLTFKIGYTLLGIG